MNLKAPDSPSEPHPAKTDGGASFLRMVFVIIPVVVIFGLVYGLWRDDWTALQNIGMAMAICALMTTLWCATLWVTFTCVPALRHRWRRP